MTTQEEQMSISQFTHAVRQGKLILRKRNVRIESEKDIRCENLQPKEKEMRNSGHNSLF